jgi:hypothetical protein
MKHERKRFSSIGSESIYTNCIYFWGEQVVDSRDWSWHLRVTSLKES